MDSLNLASCGVSNRPGFVTLCPRAAFALALTLGLLPQVLAGQPIPAAMTTHSIPADSLPLEPLTSMFQPQFGFPSGTGVYHTSGIDAAGNVYSTGGVGGGAAQLVTAGAAQTQPGGGSCLAVFGTQPCYDAYVVKADASGKLVFGTLLGGSTVDIGTALAVDAAGNVFVAGVTGGSFPTTPGAAITTAGTSTTFAAEISADGSRFLYVTYLPATVATAHAIAVDGQGDA